MEKLNYKVSVPEGKSGVWKVERFHVSENGANLHNYQCLFNGQSGRQIAPGTYTRLMRDGKVTVMSDTPAEIVDHMEVIYRAEGDVLLHGLGIGVVLNAVLKKPEVNSVIVVENSRDVIDLVGPHYLKKFSDKVRIVEGDALTWKPAPNSWWNVVWHDIWDSICSDNLSEMKTLHRRFGRRSGWQGSWSREWLVSRY